jgi:hypothetical protein
MSSGLEHLAAAEQQQLADQRDPALGRRSDGADVLGDSTVLVQLSDDEVRVVEDDREEVVEVVGNPARELPHAFQAACLVELSLERLALAGLELLLERLALAVAFDAVADVANRRGCEGAVFPGDRRQGDLRWELAPVPADAVEIELGAHLPRSRIGEVPGAMAGVNPVEALWDQGFDGPIVELLARISEQLLRLAVDH